MIFKHLTPEDSIEHINEEFDYWAGRLTTTCLPLTTPARVAANITTRSVHRRVVQPATAPPLDNHTVWEVTA